MQHRNCFEAVDRTLQDVRNSPQLFGGLPMIFSGDFAQILPVVKHGSRAEIVASCLQRSAIWPQLTVLHLRQNMRVLSGDENARFATWSRTLATAETNGPVTILDSLTTFWALNPFLDHIFPDSIFQSAITDLSTLNGRAILCVRNDGVAAINQKLLDRFPGTVTELHASDSIEIEDSTHQDQPPAEVLQSFEPASLPPSCLRLKYGVPVMLLRNLFPSEGLCNGTRLVITRILSRILEARILSGEHAGVLRMIPKIKLQSTASELPFILTRFQFPIRLSFAVTVNK